MDRILKVIIVLGAGFIAIVALTHITLGQTWFPGTTTVTPSLDSEHRFYTSLFLAYSGALFWCGRDLEQRRGVFHVLLATLFLGGLARLVSLGAVGWPHPLFIVLGAIELVLPPILWLMSRAAANAQATRPAGSTT